MTSVAVMTNAWNEGFHLPRWIAYYGGQFGHRNLFILDDGSDDGSTDDIAPVNVIRLPKAPFNDKSRREFVQCLCRNLLERFDWFIYTDVDEFLLVDPARHASLAAYLDEAEGPVITAVGLNVLHLLETDPPYQQDRTILGQRPHVEFSSGFCKPLMTREPLRWTNGFHFSSQPPTFGDVYLFHLKGFDFEIALARSRQISTVRPDSEKHAIGEGELRSWFAELADRPVTHSFDFNASKAAFLEDVHPVSNGLYVRRGRMGLAPAINVVPERFRGLL